MLPAEIDKPLTLIESQCAALAAAVEKGDALAIESMGEGLRQAAVGFSALMKHAGTADPALRARLRKLSAVLAGQRENLLRRSAVVERGLETLLPSAQKSSTYAPAGRASAYRGFAN